MRRTFAIDVLSCAEAGPSAAGGNTPPTEQHAKNPRLPRPALTPFPHFPGHNAVCDFPGHNAVCDAKTGSSYRGDTMRRPLEGPILSAILRLNWVIFRFMGVEAMRKRDRLFL